jgi:hypothetical protein
LSEQGKAVAEAEDRMSPKYALRAVFRPPIVQRSLGVALIVGTILNLINQGGALIGGIGIVYWKLALTWCVPFLVSSFGSYTALRNS